MSNKRGGGELNVCSGCFSSLIEAVLGVVVSFV